MKRESYQLCEENVEELRVEEEKKKADDNRQNEEAISTLSAVNLQIFRNQSKAPTSKKIKFSHDKTIGDLCHHLTPFPDSIHCLQKGKTLKRDQLLTTLDLDQDIQLMVLEQAPPSPNKLPIKGGVLNINHAEITDVT